MFKAGSFHRFCEVAIVGIIGIGISARFANTLLFLPKLNIVSVMAERLHERSKSVEELECLKSNIKQGHMVFKRILIMFSMTLVLSEIASLVVTVMYEPMLPLDIWYPFDWKSSSILFIICHSHQLMIYVVQGLEVISSDTYVLIYIQYLKGHVNALIIRVRKIGEKQGKGNSSEDFMELIECIKDHQHMLR